MNVGGGRKHSIYSVTPILNASFIQFPGMTPEHGSIAWTLSALRGSSYSVHSKVLEVIITLALGLWETAQTLCHPEDCHLWLNCFSVFLLVHKQKRH